MEQKLIQTKYHISLDLHKIFDRVNKIEDHEELLKIQKVTSLMANGDLSIIEHILDTQDVMLTAHVHTYFEVNHHSQIHVMGESKHAIDELLGIASLMGVPKNHVHFHPAFNETKETITKISQHNTVIVLVGPMPHSEFSNGKLQEVCGHSIIVECHTESGELKITKSSFKCALKKALDKLIFEN